MITFEQFVESLGEFAKQYTPEQLQQLHTDVKRFAQLVIATRRAKEVADNPRSPQTYLDRTAVDRTLK